MAAKGLIMLDDKEIALLPDESVDILAETAHRAINSGDEPFIFIEVQRRSYLAEDDLVRLENSYGRT